jgi:uncharacterized integral membrane protein
MSSFSAFLKGFLLCFVLIIVFCLTVANPQEVTIALDPFSELPRLTVSKPLYQIIFASFFVGGGVGGALMWFQQKKYRRMLRSMKKGHFSYDVGHSVLPGAPHDSQ